MFETYLGQETGQICPRSKFGLMSDPSGLQSRVLSLRPAELEGSLGTPKISVPKLSLSRRAHPAPRNPALLSVLLSALLSARRGGCGGTAAKRAGAARGSLSFSCEERRAAVSRMSEDDGGGAGI